MIQYSRLFKKKIIQPVLVNFKLSSYFVLANCITVNAKARGQNARSVLSLLNIFL